MLRSGLVSISFRQLSCDEVISLTAEAGLEGIEWGGDVHVPAGDVATAQAVGRATREAGLTVAAYGSYYRIGEMEPGDFQKVLDSAVALQTRIIRVWVGKKGSAEADDAYRAQVVADAKRIAAMAADAGVWLATEWHGNTLTDESASSQAFFDAVDHPAMRAYWQPHTLTSYEECLLDMNTALPRLIGLHSYSWDETTRERLPLAAHASRWMGYFQRALQRTAQPTGDEMFVLLEFVQDDEPANLLRDAGTLKGWLDEVNGAG